MGGDRLQFRISRNGDSVYETADILVGADGASSKVGQSTGWRPLVTVPLVQTEVDLPWDQSPDTTRVWFLPHETEYFFWLIPHSATSGVLGLIGRTGTDASDALATLMRFMAQKGLVPCADLQQSLIPVYQNWIPPYRRLNNGEVYLVGDAAAHVKVSTVGGIVTGFQGATGVCEAILNGGQSKGLIRLRRELDRHRLVRQMLNHFTQAEYSRLLDFLGSSTKRSLARITRDECGRLLRDILLKDPRFLTLGFMSLLRQISNKKR